MAQTVRYKALIDTVARWWRRSKGERMLLMESLLMLCIARLAVLLLPFRWLRLFLGRKIVKIDEESINEDRGKYCAKRVGKAVCSVSRYTPWESLCLSKALAAQWMLKRRGIPSALYLGVAKQDSDPEKLAAHAWLYYGGGILIGARNHEKFTVVAIFK